MQHTLRRRESEMRARRRSRSVGGWDAEYAAAASPKLLQRVPIPSAHLLSEPVTPSQRDSFMTAHSDHDDLFLPEMIAPGQPPTPSGSARTSQRLSQTRLSDSPSLFSHASQSTAPTTVAASSSSLLRPTNAAGKRASAQGAPSTLPSMREVPSPALDTAPELPALETSASKRLSLGLRDDAWLLDLDFERGGIADKPAGLDAVRAAAAPERVADAAPRRTAAVPNNRLSDEEPPALGLPESLSFSPMLMQYL